jgi:hypothetical protein
MKTELLGGKIGFWGVKKRHRGWGKKSSIIKDENSAI